MHKYLYYFVVILFIITLASAAGCVLPSPLASPSPGSTIDENTDDSSIRPPDPKFAREAAVSYMRIYHAQSAPKGELSWTEENTTPEGLVGSNAVRYTAENWIVTVSYPVVAPEAVIYQVEVTNEGDGIQWQGSVDAIGQITETAFIAQSPSQLDTYNNPAYNFSFNYPNSWEAVEHPGGDPIAGGESAPSVQLSKDGYLLIIQYKRQSETTILGPGALPPGDVVDAGSVPFFDGEIPKYSLVYEDAVKQVFYGDRVQDLEFYIQLDDTSENNYADIAIPDDTQAEVDLVLASFDHPRAPAATQPSPPETPEPEIMLYENEANQFSLQYPNTWGLIEAPHAVTFRKGNLDLIFEFRKLYESISIGEIGETSSQLSDAGTINILGKSYPRMVNVVDNVDQAVFYNGYNTVSAGEIEFAIRLMDFGTPPAEMTTALQSEADQIVASLDVSYELPADCTDKAAYVDDVSVPDGSVFLTGEQFSKTWRLRNEGTCPWTPDYELVLVDGEPLGSVDAVALTDLVAPGDEGDITISMTAPETPGQYKSEWMLRNPAGENFGVGDEANDTFWVEIEVEEGVAALELGDPTWTDTFSDASNWYLLDTANTHFSVENNHLVMTADLPGQGEEWGLSTHPGITDFYMEASFTTGDECTSLDRYGVLVRAPDPNQGYVYGFSCDGRFRLYEWDGETYQGLQNWTSSTKILTGGEQTNKLGILLSGDTIKLYANDYLLVELSDSTYDAGRFGLFIGSTNTENLKIYVTDISYWELYE